MLKFDDCEDLFLFNDEDEDVIRDTTCTESVSAFGLSNTAVVWCTLNYSIFFWHSKWDSPLAVGYSDFVVRALSLSEDNFLFAADETHIAMYYVTLGADPQGNDAKLDRRFGYTYNFGSILHMSVSPDSSLVGMSTANFLVLVDCNCAPPPKEYLEESESPLIVMNCSEWFSARGCSLTCFASEERVFVLSPRNHLVSVRPDWGSHAVVLERDGHVLTRAHNVICMAASSVRDALLVVGISDGTVKLLQMDTLDVFRTLDLVALLEKMVTQPFLQKDNRPWRACKGKGGLRRVGEGVSATVTTSPRELDYIPGTMFQAFVSDVAVGSRYITASLPEVMVYIDKNCYSLEEERVFFFAEDVGIGRPPKPRDDTDEATTATLCASNGSWVTLHTANNSLRHFVTAQGRDDTILKEDKNEEDLVHATSPLPESWLSRILLPSGDSKSGKPVTFGHKIKSAGYNDAPWSEKQKLKNSILPRTKHMDVKEPVAKVMVPYDSHKLRPMSSANRMMSSSGGLHQSAITGMIFSAGGDALFTSGSDSTVYNLKYPVTKNKGVGDGLRGHSGAALGVHTNLSLKTTLVLSSGADGTVQMWKPGVRETPFVSHKVPKALEVKAARFFYTDKFVTYTNGNGMELVKFALDNGGGDLDRKRNNSCFSAPLARMTLDAQSITAMDCINHFPSQLIVAAGTNKSINIFDVATQQAVRIISDAHTRGIHKVAMCTNSRFFSSCPLSAEHLFLTAGLDNSVNMWDLRDSKSVRKFALHKNSGLTTLGLALAPSGSFFAVGSEDRSVYIYDIGSGGAPLDTVYCNDIPTALAWHPAEPVLAIGTSSGSMLLFRQR